MSDAAQREFDIIARYFRPLAGAAGLSLLDDAAVLDPPPGRSLVLAADAMVQGVHFLPDDPPDLVARKLLRVNLSDLAAMGAAPLGYLLTISVPRDTPDMWFGAFTRGLAMDQTEFGLPLLGGDTTSTPGPVSLSLTIIGTVVPGRALSRAGAQPGDDLWVSGTIGDGALGLRAARGEIPDPDGYLADRYRLPRPRLTLGAGLAGIAHAAMDVSDGLVQDTAHICRASGVAAVIEAHRLPLSAAAGQFLPGALPEMLTGGDDYELVLAVPPERTDALRAVSAMNGVPVTRIGTFGAGRAKVLILDHTGQPVELRRGGWSHLG